MAGGLRRATRGISPVLATIILLAVFVTVIVVALGFAETELSAYSARSDLSIAKSFAMDASAAITQIGFSDGASQSLGYGFRSAALAYIPSLVVYNFTFTYSGSVTCPKQFTPLKQGVCELIVDEGGVVVSIPAHYFSLGSGYCEIIYPRRNLCTTNFSTISEEDTSLSLAYVYQQGGLFIYVAIIPFPSAENATTYPPTLTQTQTIYNLYIPLFTSNSSNIASQKVISYPPTGDVSIQGLSQTTTTLENIKSISISATFRQPYFPSPVQVATLSCPQANCGVNLFNGTVLVGG